MHQWIRGRHEGSIWGEHIEGAYRGSRRAYREATVSPSEQREEACSGL